MVAVMDGDEIGPFNIGNPGEFTMLELAEVRQLKRIDAPEPLSDLLPFYFLFMVG
jgi:hypothetical protein